MGHREEDDAHPLDRPQRAGGAATSEPEPEARTIPTPPRDTWRRNCECEGEAACDAVRPQVPTEKFVLTFLRQGDDFVPTPRTKRRLDEIKRQW